MKPKARPDLRPVRQKTLNSLEGPAWADPDFPSGMVQRIRALGSIPLAEFSAGDLRLVIGQRRGLLYLVPIAVEQLEEDPLLDAGIYPGDLLMSLEQAPDEFWAAHPDLKLRTRHIMEAAQSQLAAIPDYDPWSPDHAQLNAYDRDSLLPRLRAWATRFA